MLMVLPCAPKLTEVQGYDAQHCSNVDESIVATVVVLSQKPTTTIFAVSASCRTSAAMCTKQDESSVHTRTRSLVIVTNEPRCDSRKECRVRLFDC